MTVRKSLPILAMFSAVTVLVTACGQAEAGPAGQSVHGCPPGILELLGSDNADVAVDINVDSTASGLHDDAWRAQFRSIAEEAVSQGAGVRLTTFSSALSSLTVLVDCPSTAPLVRNNSARASQQAEMTERVAEALLTAAETPAAATANGSDIAGGLRAVADLPARAAKTAIVVLSDGFSTVAVEPPSSPFLKPNSVVGMYGVGRVQGQIVDTAQTDALVTQWKSYLLAGGATAPIVTTNLYSAGALLGGVS